MPRAMVPPPPWWSPRKLVAGHSARVIMRMVGDDQAMRELLRLIKADLPRANVFYWLVPVLEQGRL